MVVGRFVLSSIYYAIESWRKGEFARRRGELADGGVKLKMISRRLRRIEGVRVGSEGEGGGGGRN